jgi:hypothetical protein
MQNKICLIVLIFLYSCSSLNPFESEGEYTEKKVELSNITDIRIENAFKIVFVQDDEEYILFKGGENLVKKTSNKLEGNQLTLDHNYKNIARNLDLISVEIHLKQFNKIIANAPSNISSKDLISGETLKVIIYSDAEIVEMDLKLDYNTLDFHSYGSAGGGYEFSGTATTSKYVMNGITNIKASGLKSNTVTIAQNGIGDAHVWAEEALNLTIYNSGDIYYKGNPIINTSRVQVNNQNPSGKIIQEK